MKHTPSQTKLFVINITIALLIFIGDLFIPRNIAIDLLYIIPILMCILLPRSGYIYLMAIITTVFTIIGYLTSPPDAAAWTSLTNCGVTLAMIWITVILCIKLMQDRLLNRAIIDTAVDGIITINSRGIIETFNTAAEGIFGYPAKDMIGRNIFMLMPSPYHEEHDHYLKNYLDTGQKKIIGIGREVQGVRKDGTIFPMDLSVGEYRGGQDGHFVGIVRDITARKVAEQNVAIRTNQLAILSRLGEQLLNGMTFEELTNEIAYAVANTLNVKYVRILELLPDKKNLLFHNGIGWPQRMFKGMILPVDTDSVLAHTLQTGKPVVFTDLNTDPRFKDVSRLIEYGIVSGISTIIGDTSAPFGILCANKEEKHVFSGNEINFVLSAVQLLGIAIERTRIETRVRDLQKKMLKVTRSNVIGELGTALAHELNQPITALMNYANACRRFINSSDVNNAGNIFELMDKIVNEVNRAAMIINHLRDYVNSGTLYKKPEDLNKVTQDACELVLAEALEKNIPIKCIIQPNLPPVSVDKIQIQQVIYNLLHNSMQAMEQSVKRKITVMAMLTSGQAIEVLIQDTGPGINPEIFGQHLMNILSTKEEGMGIGLSICKSIIDGHEGRFWTTVTPGGGATVHFTLPIAKAGNGRRAE